MVDVSSLLLSFFQPSKAQAASTANQETASRLVCAAGLAEMENRKYKNAARLLTKASIEHCKFPDVRTTCLSRLV